MTEQGFEDGEPPVAPAPTTIDLAAEGRAELGSAEETAVAVVGGAGSGGSAGRQVRRHGPGEGDGGCRRGRWRIEPPAVVVVVVVTWGEPVLGGDEGEEALTEAGGADTGAQLVRVLLALHRRRPAAIDGSAQESRIKRAQRFGSPSIPPTPDRDRGGAELFSSSSFPPGSIY